MSPLFPRRVDLPTSPLPSLPRRRFLRGLSGAATVFGAPLWLTACGGGDGGAAPDPSADPASDPAAPSTPDTPDAPGTPGASGDGSGDPSSPAPQPEAMDTTIRRAALRAVEQACRSLAHQQPSLPPLAFVEQVAAGMRTMAAYAEVGVDADALTAWGVFSDGRVHLVSNAPHPQRRPAGAVGSAVAPRTATALAAGHELPAASTARLLQSFGPEFDSADVIGALDASLRQVG
jgi:hypothetical protein